MPDQYQYSNIGNIVHPSHSSRFAQFLDSSDPETFAAQTFPSSFFMYLPHISITCRLARKGQLRAHDNMNRVFNRSQLLYSRRHASQGQTDEPRDVIMTIHQAIIDH